MKKIIKKEKRKKTSEEKRATRGKRRWGSSTFAQQKHREPSQHIAHTQATTLYADHRSRLFFKKKYAETCVKVL